MPSHDLDAADTEPICIYVCVKDDELRAWLVDELSLMTWTRELKLEFDAGDVHDQIRPERLDLVIVGLDRIVLPDLDLLRAYAWTAPTIAIGAVGDPSAIGFDRVLDVRLTSRELKQAIRETMFERGRSSAVR